MTARAVRVRKARRASRLSCGHYVLAGHQIGRRDGGWICIECALAGLADLAKIMTTPPRPGRSDDATERNGS